MSQWVSYDEIKSRVSIEDILDHYSLDMRRRRDELKGRCPFPGHEDQRASFSANGEKNIFQCFGCKKSGNILDFVAFMEGVDLRAAALLIAEWFQISSETAINASVRGEDGGTGSRGHDQGNKPLTFELKLDPDHAYLKGRGLKVDTVLEFGLGYCNRGLMKDRIAIPIHNESAELVAYAGRWPGEPPDDVEKYILPPRFHKSQVVYNLHRVRELATKQRELIVVEGFFSVFNFWQAGVQNVVALMGSSLGPKQKEQLVQLLQGDGKLTLLFDDDGAGRECTLHCLQELSPSMFVKAPRMPPSISQPDQLSGDQIQQLFIL